MPYKLILCAGAAFLLLGCSHSPTEPTVRSAQVQQKHDEEDYCDARSGYWVRAGRQTSEPCVP